MNKYIKNFLITCSVFSLVLLIGAYTFQKPNEIDQLVLKCNEPQTSSASAFDACYNLGHIYNEKGTKAEYLYSDAEQAQQNYELAIFYFTKALEIMPNDLSTLLNRGAVYHAAGQYEASLADNNKAIELQPQLYEPHWNQGLTLEKMGRTQEAIAKYEMLLEWFADPKYLDFRPHRQSYIDDIEAHLENLRSSN